MWCKTCAALETYINCSWLQYVQCTLLNAGLFVLIVLVHIRERSVLTSSLCNVVQAVLVDLVRIRK